MSVESSTMLLEPVGQVVPDSLDDDRQISQCRICGANKAILCNFNGFGIRRRRHERRCAARKAMRTGQRQNEVRPQMAEPLPITADVSAIKNSSSNCLTNAVDGTLSDASTTEEETVAQLPSLPSTASSASLVAGATATAAAVWMEAPIIAGSLLLATVVLCWRLQRNRWGNSCPQDTLRSSVGDMGHSLGGEVEKQRPALSILHPTDVSSDVAEVVRLTQRFHIQDAIRLAKENGLLDTVLPHTGVVELDWLRRVAPAASTAAAGPQAPPAPLNGAPWTGPLESAGANWQMSFWYSWSGPSTLSTVSKLVVPGTVAQALSIFRESDYCHHWMPFVTGSSCSWSSDVPGQMTIVKAKIPILPKHLKMLVHRAFVDAADTRGGVLMVEWTPSAEDLASGYYCGMEVPRDTQNASELRVDLATTLITPEDDGRCSIVMSGTNEFNVSRRLVPDFLLRRFLSVNSRTLAQRICSCLEDLQGKGYLDRIEADPQGFYQGIEAHLAEHSARN